MRKSYCRCNKFVDLGIIEKQKECCHSFCFSIIPRSTNLLQRQSTFAHLTLASIWKKIWEACEILNLKHGSISCWYSVVILFVSLLFRDQQNYYNGNNFCAFDASFDLKKDLRSLWNSEPKTWFHFLLVFCCHSFCFSYYSEINKFITTAITFAHLTLASIWKKIWEACEILNLKHGSISCWYSVVILFFSLLFRDQQNYYNGNDNFANLTLASIWISKIWEACEILNLKHGSNSCWYSVVILFVSLLFRDQQNYYNGNNFCAFDASFDLKKDLRSLWNSEPKTWFHFPVGILLSFFLFLYYSEINKIITTAITFAHLTLASIWKKIWEACEILKLKHGFISCWYSVFILFVSLLFRDQQNYYNGNTNFCAFDASLDLKKDFRSLWNSEPKTWFQ